MASGSADSSVSSPRGSAPGIGRQSDQYIEQQLGKTRIHVKLVDLCTMGLILLGGVLGFVFLAILVDHWIIEIGTLGRWCLLALLLVGVAAYVSRFLLPLFIKRINPVYAAWTIEQSSPSLKNSLINYLSFRGSESATGRLVFNAMKQRAANDLSHVNVDTAVDRSRLIRIGYVVVAMMIALAAYTIFSPKDVFQSVGRVAAPWADIARPSRVEIADIKPGDAEVTYGQHVTISALVSGVDDDEDIQLFYTTEDKQIVERVEIMQQPEGSRRFECTLPSSDDGMRQGLTYRIEAGDARTQEFQLRVLPAPTILVDRVEYRFPAYTRRQPKSITKRGDIQALEGTRVTIHARASQPIQTAFIEFDPLSESGNGQRGEVYRLQVDDSEPSLATYSFPLLLADDRRTAQYASYQLTFLTAENQRSQNTIVHRIHVSRDLAPEIAILTPTLDRIEVPENGSQMIEVRAVDPDFGLSHVALRAVATGEELLDEPLLAEQQGQLGQVMSTYHFLPNRLGLVAGDTVVYWAVAEDNRTDPQTGASDPNNQRTRNYHITVVAADPRGAERLKGEPTPAKPPQPNDTDESQDAEEKGQEGEGQEGEGQEGEGSETGESDGSEGGQDGQQTQDGQTGQDQTGQGAGQTGSEQEPSDTQDKGGSTQGGSSGTESSSESTEGEQTSSSGGQTGDSQQQDSQQQESQQQDSQQQESQQQESQQQESQQQESQTGQQGNPSTAPNSQAGSGDPQNMDSEAPNGQATQPGQQPSPGQRTEPLHDGDAFEQMLEHMQQQQNDDQEGSTSNAGQQNDTQDSSTTDSGQQSDQTDSLDGQQPDSGSQMQDSSTSSESPKMSDSPDSGEPSSQNSDPDQGSQPSGSDPQQGTSEQPQTGPGDPTLQPQETASGSSGQPTESSSAPAGSDPSQQTGDSSSGSEVADSGSSSEQQSEGSTGQQTGEGRPKGEGESSDGDPPKDTQDGSPQEGSESPSQDEGGSGQGNNSQEQGSGNSPQSDPKGTESNPGQATDPEADQAAGQADQGDRRSEGGEGGEEGGQTQPSDGGNESSNAKGPAEGNQDGQPPQQSPQDDGPPSDRTDGASSSSPQGGGLPNETGPDRPEQPGEVTDGDPANLDYARRATDLVLEQLQDDQEKPDDELLKKLGWTQEELQAFLRRWGTMKKAAEEGGREEQAELDDALRSLGLRPSGQNRRRGSSKDDQHGGLRDAGSRSRPPAEFLDKFDAYKKGAARSAGQPRP